MARHDAVAIVALCLGMLVGCEKADEAAEAASQVAEVQMDQEKTADDQAEQTETYWEVELTGAQEAVFEGKRIETEQHTDDNSRTLRLAPQRADDERFNEHTGLEVVFQADAFDGGGTASIDKDNASFTYASIHGGEYECQALEPTEISFEEYSEARIAGSYAATMSCESQTGRLLGETEVTAEFDVPRG